MHNTYVTRFKDLISSNPAIESIGMSDELPGKEIRYPGTYTYNGITHTASFPINTIGIDDNFLQALQFHFLAGRNFSQQFKTDNNALVMTASAARLFGFNDMREAVGKQLAMGNENYTIVGVVSDYHQLSLQKEAEPIIFQFDAADAREFEYYLIKPKADNIVKAIDDAKDAWNESFKDNPFSFTFLDDDYNLQYKNIRQFELLFAVFALIAIIIACIGLFAMLAFMIQQRVKEIGIRKVLGANRQSIVRLLSKDFLKLIAMANLFAWPLGWLMMNNWLKDFAYRVHIHLGVFIASSLVAGIIAMTTISIQAIKAARENPVNSLRGE
jgi:putative ABC transport system permease protein